LARAGYDVGAIDGFLGLKTQQAVKAMQVKYNLPADSYPTPELLARMRSGHRTRCPKNRSAEKFMPKNELERNAKAISRPLPAS
jgi:peptidoglycan hydrolase-like protein with peptidoglycan-binding domain